MIETHLSRYNHYASYRNMEIYNLGNRYAIAPENEELFCDEYVKDDDLSIEKYHDILKFFGAVTEEQIFFNNWSFQLEVRSLSYFTNLEDCKEAIDYLCNREEKSYIVYNYNLLRDLESFTITSKLWSVLKKPSPYRAHYKCVREEVQIFGEKIYGSHYTFYYGKDIIANFVQAADGGLYLISCSQDDVWDALKVCKVVNEDYIKKE